MSEYWKSSWAGEDGGPRRLQRARNAVIPTISADSQLDVTSRDAPALTMAIVGPNDELFLQRIMPGPAAISWVEKIDPITLEVIAQSEQLAGGPLWPGGLAAHANGSLYVVFGNHAHRLSADLQVIVSVELPRLRPYNSFVILPSGHLATKDFSGALPGQPNGTPMEPTELLILDPQDLRIVARLELAEPSIARLSADGNDIYVVGDYSLIRVFWRNETLIVDTTFNARYRTLEGQTFGWDAVITDEDAWFLDNGEGTQLFMGSFRGVGISSAPLHLVRVNKKTAQVTLTEICGLPDGIIANPPVVDTQRQIVVGFDSGNGVISGFDYDEDSVTPRWSRQQNHACHMLLSPEAGQIVTADHRPDLGCEQVVILDITTGHEVARVSTTSPIQSAVFPAIGPKGDIYWCSMSTITRISVR
ncbi:unannotated protein [freshwater metagenome]|uniref:Unannotated protein n=1 Tax=freshwater metagenome TaxID=449393 RepID=A0A6J7W079_9ZZZZ|nr:hypothetical protein [Actinomycetota bacterium]